MSIMKSAIDCLLKNMIVMNLSNHNKKEENVVEEVRFGLTTSAFPPFGKSEQYQGSALTKLCNSSDYCLITLTIAE